MKISAYIILAFIFIFLLFGITTLLNFQLSKAVNAESTYVNASTEIIRSSNRFQRNVLDMVSGLRGFLITGEKYFVEVYDSASVENESIIHELRPLITDQSQNKLLSEIEGLHNVWKEEYAEPLRQAKLQSGFNEKNLSAFNKIYKDKFLTGKEKQLQTSLRSKFREFSNREYAIRNERKAELGATAERAKNVSLILVITSVITGGIIVWVLVQKVSKRIGTMVRMADKIASGDYSVAVHNNSSRDELSALESSLNHMAAELSNYITLLRSKNQELDQYAHIVSHDMKGPLRGISNVISWIEEDHSNEMSPKLKEYLELIKSRVNRGEYLIKGILDYARADRELMPVEHVKVKDLISEAVETVSVRPGITLNIQTALPELRTEKLPLFQIFTNLISNAAKHHHKNEGIINIYHRELKDHYQFFVEDDGPGIEKEYFDKIFQAFQTLHERDSFESSGVGLAIVKKLLDRRGESIQVSSLPGKGTTFSFTWNKI